MYEYTPEYFKRIVKTPFNTISTRFTILDVTKGEGTHITSITIADTKEDTPIIHHVEGNDISRYDNEKHDFVHFKMLKRIIEENQMDYSVIELFILLARLTTGLLQLPLPVHSVDFINPGGPVPSAVSRGNQIELLYLKKLGGIDYSDEGVVFTPLGNEWFSYYKQDKTYGYNGAKYHTLIDMLHDIMPGYNTGLLAPYATDQFRHIKEALELELHPED